MYADLNIFPKAISSISLVQLTGGKNTKAVVEVAGTEVEQP